MFILIKLKKVNPPPQGSDLALQKEDSKLQDDEYPQSQSQRGQVVKQKSVTEKIKNKQSITLIQYLPYSSRTSILSQMQIKKSPVQEELLNFNEQTHLSQFKRNQSIISQFDKPDNLLNFYQNVMNVFPSGILIINHQKKILYMNNKCEKLLEAQGKENIFNTLLQCFRNGQFSENEKKKMKSPLQMQQKNIQHQIQFEEMIKTMQNSHSNEIDIIDYLLQRNSFAPSPYNHGDSSSKSQTVHPPSSSNLSYDFTTPVINFYAPFKDKNKILKFSIIQANLNSSSVDQISQPSHKLQQGGFSSALEQEHVGATLSNSILYITIKNVTTKQRLQEVQKEYKFQNLLLKSFSHELRTPLNCSIQMLQLLMDLTLNDEKIQACISQALHSNQLLMYQINDILDFAAMECHQFQYKWEMVKVDLLAKEFKNIYDEACKSKNINFQVKLDPQLEAFYVRTDRSRIMQILVNLMNNAIKFTKENGKITTKIKLESTEGNPTIKIVIKDNGVGVNGLKLSNLQKAMKKQRSMFESIRSSKKTDDVGLGLSISNSIVQGLCDEKNILNITSHNLKGTKVCFRVQNRIDNVDKSVISEKMLGSKKSAFFQQSFSKYANDGEDENSVQQLSDLELHKSIDVCIENQQQNRGFFQKQTPTLFSFENKGSVRFQNSVPQCTQCIHVLIVDDVPFNQIALKALLSQRKIESDSAYDGYQAVDKVTQKLAGHCPSYKVIFMDIEMPGMNGFQATSQIKNLLRQKGLDSYVVMCSAYDTFENLAEGKKAGMSDFVGKPVKKIELERVARQYLNLEVAEQ